MSYWTVAKNSDAPARALVLRTTEAGTPLAGYIAAHRPRGADILVRVRCAALNPADLQFMRILPTWLPFRQNAVPGLDFCGEIVAMGPAAAAVPAFAAAPLTVGALVAGCMSVPRVATAHGALAEYVTVPAALVARVPPALVAEGQLAQAAGFLGCAGQTAHLVATDTASETAYAMPGGARVLVNGASGGVGSLLVQIAKARGAHVVGVCSAANADFVSGLGADATIDYTAHAELHVHLAQTTDAPYDLIYDCVGDQALFSHSAGYLAPSGALLSIVGGPTQGVVPFVRNKLVPTFLGGTARTYKILGLAPSGERARAVAQWVDDGTLATMPIDSEYAMADVVQAYEKLATKRARGKIIINVQA